jgi:hypothetical protein
LVGLLVVQNIKSIDVTVARPWLGLLEHKFSFNAASFVKYNKKIATQMYSHRNSGGLKISDTNKLQTGIFLRFCFIKETVPRKVDEIRSKVVSLVSNYKNSYWYIKFSD